MNSLNIGIVVNSQDLWDDIQGCVFDRSVRVVLERKELGDWGEFLAKLDELRPDVLLVDFDQLNDPLGDVIKQIKSTAGRPKVIVASDTAEPEKILKAIRANADEYIYLPVRNDLTAALDRIGAQRHQDLAGTRPRGKVIGLLSSKGGCGATTIACHLAVELRRQTGLEVLLADFDVDTGVIGFLMKTRSRYSVLDAVDNVHRMDLSFWKALVSNGKPGLEVISAPSSAGDRREKKPEDFCDVVRFVRSNYDWTVVDLGRSVGPFSMSVLEELDEVYLVTTLDIPALHQAKIVVRALLDSGMATHRLNLLVNRMPKRMDITVSEFEKMIGVPIYEALPNDYSTIYDAFAAGTLVSEKSKIGRAYSKLARKIGGVPTSPKRSIPFLS